MKNGCTGHFKIGRSDNQVLCYFNLSAKANQIFQKRRSDPKKYVQMWLVSLCIFVERI